MLLGFDVGGTKSAVVVGTAEGVIHDRLQFASEAARGPDAMIADLLAAADQLRRRHRSDHGDVTAAGVSIGGPLDAIDGIIHNPPNLPGWNDIRLRAILQQRLGVVVRVEHDAAACCLAEYRWGAGRDARRLIYLTCGTGFGAGMVFDGTIYRGVGGRSVEVGHARLRTDGPIGFGKRGSVEGYCAASALGRIAAWRYPERYPQPIESSEIVRQAASGVAEAADVLRINAASVGEVCAWLGDLLRPDMILLGSAARYFGDGWVADVRVSFAAEALADTSANCRMLPAGLGDRLQDCSALAVATEM